MKIAAVSMVVLVGVLPFVATTDVPANYPREHWRDLARSSTLVIKGTVVHRLIWVERPSKRTIRVVRHPDGTESSIVPGMDAFEGRVTRVAVEEVVKPNGRVNVGNRLDILEGRDMEFGWQQGDTMLFFLKDPPQLPGTDAMTGWMSLRGTTIRDPDTGREEPFQPEQAFTTLGVSTFQTISSSKLVTPENAAEIQAIVDDVKFVSDVTLPVVTITAPSSGTTVGGVVPLEATATDNIGVAEVQFTVDGQPAGGAVTSGPFQSPWSSVATADGSHTIGATARDGTGNRGTAAPIVVNVDNTPPQLAVVAEPSAMWPPTNKLIPIKVKVAVRDVADPAPVVRLTSISVNEPAAASDVADASIGADDREFKLRASRSGTGTGRVYTITYEASDRAGNNATATTTVTVRHDQGN